MSTTKTVRKPRINAGKEKKHSSKGGKREEYVREHAGLRLLGEIITWHPGGSGHSHAALIAGLQAAGLNHEVAKELLPRHAFTRAAKKLAEDRVIDPVNEDHDSIKFQFTKRFIEDNEWKYSKECYLELDKHSGKVSCPANPDLEQLAQQEVDRAMEVRTSADVTKIIQRLFDAEADLFPIRDQGGVYFVPHKFSAFVDKVESFLTALSGYVNRFPVPADTRQGDKNVQDTIVNGLSSLLKEHQDAVNAFGLDTRHDTLERAAERIKATRVKIEAYAEYLQERKDELLAAADAARADLIGKVKKITEERANAPAVETGGGTRAFIFNHSVTAVIRWMGANKWGFKDTRRVIDAYVGAGKVADATLRAQLLGGRQGPEARGEPAKLTDEEVAELSAKKEELTQEAAA